MTVTRWPSSNPECRSNRFAKRTPRQVIDRFLSVLKQLETRLKEIETFWAHLAPLPPCYVRGPKGTADGGIARTTGVNQSDRF